MATPRVRPRRREVSRRSGTVPTYAEFRSAPSEPRRTEALRARGAQWLLEFSLAAQLTLPRERAPPQARAISFLDSPWAPPEPSARAQSVAGLRTAAATRSALHHSSLAGSKTVAPAQGVVPALRQRGQRAWAEDFGCARCPLARHPGRCLLRAAGRRVA